MPALTAMHGSCEVNSKRAFSIRVSGEPAEPLIVRPVHVPVLAGERVNRMGALLVPTASRRPLLATVIPVPLSKQTFTPAPIVSVAPGAIVTELVTI